MPDAVQDLLAFIDASPSPYHAVAETARRLRAANYEELDERDAWQLEPGARRYVVRAEGSIVAFELGSAPVAEAGLHVVGAHTDSPNLRIKQLPDRTGHGVAQLTVEPYGGLLLPTWFDRDCSIAGRVTVQAADGTARTVLVDLERPLLRVPMLAIHLGREITETGFQPNAQTHAQPLWGLAGAPSLRAVLAEALGPLGHGSDRILAHDLMLYDVQRAAVSGVNGDFVHAARLDNLASCHAGLSALIAPEAEPLPAFTRAIAFWDHEEVGSRSAQGAAGPFLRDVVARLAGDAESQRRALARSFLISADMAHGVHPNYPERHEPEHRPLLGGGPVIKWNVNQSYTSDAESGGRFAALCARVGVEPQHYSHRNDLRCGTTIGPLSAAKLGIKAVDVGNPMLSMHSCREMCATADVEPMIRVLGAFLETRGGSA
jgi:aspartyl aminopeptidase